MFSTRTVVSWHGAGRSVPESYCDAWRAGAELGREWVLQLEDDVELAPDFEGHAARILSAAAAPHIGLVSFFSHARLSRGEKLPDEPTFEVLRGPQFFMAQAIAMRTSDVEDHNRFVLEFTLRNPFGTDNATGHWLGSRKHFFARAWPSLVQHGSLPSLSGHGRRDLSSPSYRAVYGA